MYMKDFGKFWTATRQVRQRLKPLIRSWKSCSLLKRQSLPFIWALAQKKLKGSPNQQVSALKKQKRCLRTWQTRWSSPVEKKKGRDSTALCLQSPVCLNFRLCRAAARQCMKSWESCGKNTTGMLLVKHFPETLPLSCALCLWRFPWNHRQKFMHLKRLWSSLKIKTIFR